MSSVKAILRIDKINAKGLAPLYLRSTHNRKSAFKALGIYIHPDDWDAVAEKVRKSKRVPNSTRINNLIAAQKLEVQNYLLDGAVRSRIIHKPSNGRFPGSTTPASPNMRKII